MLELRTERIPSELKSVAQWVLWKTILRDGRETKAPYQVNGAGAKSNDPETWSTFDEVVRRYALGSWSGIGFVFSPEDPFTGVDLDGCRNPDNGELAPWAKEIVLNFQSYCEVSPSETGVKIWVKGNWPYSGHKIELDVEKTSAKTPAIEVYDSVRYFAVTGHRLAGMREVKDAQQQLDDLRTKFWKETVYAPSPSVDWRSESAVMDRAAKYLAKMPVSVSGQNGSAAAFHAACSMVRGFDLSKSQALSLLREWNVSCLPPWSEHELQHKVDDADKLIGDRGYLRNASPQRWDRIAAPAASPKRPDEPVGDDLPEIEVSTTETAANLYREKKLSGSIKLLELGLPQLDFAIGGGVEPGEMIIFAARPSHGKSMGAMQVLHHFTAWGIPGMFVSEEMGKLAIGKRVIQFASDVPVDDWQNSDPLVQRQLQEHFASRAPCYILEKCRNVERVALEIKRFVSEKNVGIAVVDYAQQLAAYGKNRCDEITHVSKVLTQTAKECQIPVIVLCQLNRAIENRRPFVPQMSDLKESGQLEQDADVIVFQVWPHRIDQEMDPDEYKLYVAKNRNRPINKGVVTCKFNPARQMLEPQPSMSDVPDFNIMKWD